MYKRLELHNHTTESDAGITCQDLTDIMLADNVDAFALTDHNTISGHRKIKKILEEQNSPISCIYGMEYTTYYGHILCLNLTEYVPWENINKHKPELLFHAAREKGALVGVAHPFSFGWPFAQGCRFEMTISDYSCCDFIEIINNPEPLSVNRSALLWWESLVLAGNPLAATCGMDLHGKDSFHGYFSTYIEGTDSGLISREIADAIRSQRTWVCKGVLLETAIHDGILSFSFIQTGKPGYEPLPDDRYLIVLKSASGIKICRIDDHIALSSFGEDTIIIPELYEDEEAIENLVCVSPVITL